MISGNPSWTQNLAQAQKQPLYAFQVAGFGVVLASSSSVSSASGTPTVKRYYPGDFNRDLSATLAWLLRRQSGAIGNWLGNAAATPTTSAQFSECGFDYLLDLTALAQEVVENIVITPPAGVLCDSAAGPDGFPLNYNPQGGSAGPLFLNTFQNDTTRTISGQCYGLRPGVAYRVDVYSRTDQFYYQGSAYPDSAGAWSMANVHPGALLAVLYPGGTLPSSGYFAPTVPSGWVAHSNMGVGPKLRDCFARVSVKTDMEYLQEDNVPIIVQDAKHARAGSSVAIATGTPTVHIVENDPVAGPVEIFTSLQLAAAYQGLVRSFSVPTSDPLYLPDVTATNSPALQNRGFIYDQAMAIIAFCATGNYSAAQFVIKQLNDFLDHPGYLASRVLENAEDGSTARWTAVGGTVANAAADSISPKQPPYGNGKVIQFTSTQSGATFTYSVPPGAGLPDATDTQLSFQHYDAPFSTALWTVDIEVVTSQGKVTSVQVSNNTAGPATFSATAKSIQISIGYNGGNWRTTLVDLQSQVSSLASDTLTDITSFKVTLNYVGTFYLDNLSVGGTQPADSLSFSYDIYYGQIDQAYIRAGAMAWVCYAYALYMQLSKDYSSALHLQRMINFLLTLQSAADDLTNGLFYLGYGEYQDPGYQFLPGLVATVSTEHQISLYFAFQRTSQILPTAAAGLLKATAIDSAQASSLSATAAQVADVASTIVGKIFTNLWIAPGTDPGHFAQGATGNTLDPSQALDAGGAWAAIFCHAAGDDARALECLKFAYHKFYLQGQTIQKSNQSNSYNQAFEQLTPFSGLKTYNESAGGYSGSPVSVWQEGTWGMILALLNLYDVAGVQAYFRSVDTTIDAVLATLISGQATVKSATAGTYDAGALLGWSMAARGLPWEFEVWPMLAPTAWWYTVAVNPSFLLSASSTLRENTLPYLFIPTGSGQTADELNGTSSIGTLSVESIDPSGAVKGLIAQNNLIGQPCQLSIGFPGQNLSDFVTVETRQISATGWSSDGRIRIEAADVQRFIMGAQAFLLGGPSAWTPGLPTPTPPNGAQWLPNAYPIGSQNPRYIQGNPLDIYLAVMQNELGVGQDPLVPRPNWALYRPGQPNTLINPNPYIDVLTVLELQSGLFSGDWFEFKITSAQEGKQWLEDQILKPLGLFHLTRASGLLSLKSIKAPQVLSPVMAFTDKNILGIPEVDRLPVINYLTLRFNVDYEQGESVAVQKWAAEVTYQQATSIAQYKQYFKHQIEAEGLRVERGGLLRGFLIADRVFRRHAFATPRYKVKTQLSTLVVEVGDFVYLTHRWLPDFQSGSVGLSGVVCEVADRKPNYAEGYMEFELLDTRFMSLTQPYRAAPLSAGIPSWNNATAGERAEYMFVSLASMDGENPDGSPGNTIF